MSSLSRISFLMIPLILSGLALIGCASGNEVKPEAIPPQASLSAAVQPEMPRVINPQSATCRSCHAAGNTSGAKDFSAIYDQSRAHHPVSIRYPLAGPDAAKYFPPNGHGADFAFFDRNDNGQRDPEEVVLFGSGDEVTVECASCHMEHNAPSARQAMGQYLRISNDKSALCTACHRL